MSTDKNSPDLTVIPRQDHMESIVASALLRAGRSDSQLAPIWAERLRHSYAKVMETEYPEYKAAMGGVLPIDTSVSPAALEWEYYMVDQAGFAAFIDDDGKLMPSSATTASRHTGKMAELGHGYDLTLFDLERAVMEGLPLSNMKQKHAKKAHDAKTNFVWMFGDAKQGIVGLCNHPNINVTLAPLNGGASSRLWANKTADEIAADVSTLIDTIASNTLEAHHAAKVFLPFSLIRRMRNLRISTAGDGFSSVWDWMQDRFSGDATGQGKVTFEGLNECEAARRLDPETGTDTSGISGDFLLAIPNAGSDEMAFIRARPFTQLPPQEDALVLKHYTHSKIGGCKLQIPLAVHRMDFGLT